MEYGRALGLIWVSIYLITSSLTCWILGKLPFLTVVSFGIERFVQYTIRITHTARTELCFAVVRYRPGITFTNMA